MEPRSSKSHAVAAARSSDLTSDTTAGRSFGWESLLIANPVAEQIGGSTEVVVAGAVVVVPLSPEVVDVGLSTVSGLSPHANRTRARAPTMTTERIEAFMYVLSCQRVTTGGGACESLPFSAGTGAPGLAGVTTKDELDNGQLAAGPLGVASGEDESVSVVIRRREQQFAAAATGGVKLARRYPHNIRDFGLTGLFSRGHDAWFGDICHTGPITFDPQARKPIEEILR